MWLSPNSYLPKFSVQSSDNFILEKIYPLISPQYRLTNDTGHYIELARNFNAESLKRSPIFERPLYSLLIRLTSSIFQVFTPSSYGITFVSAILLNFILAAFTVLLFFKTLGKLFPLRIAYLSSILLIFSPFFHIFLIQAVPSILSAFTAVVSLYLLQDYIKKSSIKKLILFSLIIGILLLGKMFFSISFFILLLALYFKRYREGIVFSAVHLIPFGLWYLWLTKIWQIPYSSYEVNYYQAESWVFNIFQWPWNQTFQIFLRSVPNFFESL
ncbi:MAG: glycosyltransferase family 39 protein, partial [Candidatus Parcubacteria bacterium]|nr:glycosyltransferase family 39 protein [Candidatus Parcubacteria bacterium]